MSTLPFTHPKEERGEEKKKEKKDFASFWLLPSQAEGVRSPCWLHQHSLACSLSSLAGSASQAAKPASKQETN